MPPSKSARSNSARTRSASGKSAPSKSAPSKSAPRKSTQHTPPSRGTTRKAAAPASVDLLAQAETAAWFVGKDLSDDWTSWHFPKWMRLLGPVRRRRLRMLEIGSWEGRSALFFLNYLPQAHLTCVDTFAGGQEHREAAARSEDEARKLSDVEKRFDRNVQPFGSRVEKIKAGSVEGLARLGVAKRRFDFAYIDGGHRASEVYADAVMTWPLIAPGGIVLFDDYQWDEMPEPLDNPKPGVDAFLKAMAGEYEMLMRSYQIAIRKKPVG